MQLNMVKLESSQNSYSLVVIANMKFICNGNYIIAIYACLNCKNKNAKSLNVKSAELT